MCERDEFHRDERVRLSRRGFGTMAGAAGVAMLWQGSAVRAQDVTGSDVEIVTPDGTADAYFVHPGGNAPGVVMWPDIFGLRPAFRAMADRLAGAGYAVLVVNPFYRDAKGMVVRDGEEMSAAIDRLRPYASHLTPAAVTSDAIAFTAWLDDQPAVDTGRRIGAVGFCMSGSYTIRAAAALPERVGAGASFHGGGLATDAPDSPHLLAPETQARFLFAIAQNDDAKDPQAKTRLAEAFGNRAEVEVYPADHGWVPPDGARHDEVQAERAWARMLALFGGALA
ncbi:MAG: dienelactone hydrolase family protein [Amaricoccus sp.]|uniref:dienelactone hydrolase family protein n=1 Tax=Amaricoccus sp. TaxID=1872485 RepID=UPI0039E67091